VSRRTLSRQAKRRPHQGNSLGVSRRTLSRQAKRRPHQGNSLGVSRRTLSRQAKRRPHQGNSLGVSRRTLLRQAAQKCVGKSMSRHRGLPRAALSTDTHLQSLWKDILRQHLAKFHYVHPTRPTPSSRTRSFRTTRRLILHDPPRHPELVSVPLLRKSSTSLMTWSSHPELVSVPLLRKSSTS
jgi:hypothetical protein